MIAFSDLYENLKEFNKYICTIFAKQKIGTGVFLKLKKGNSFFYFLLTSEYLITDELIESKTEIEIRYNINSKNKEYNKFFLRLDEENRFIRSYNYLGIDATIVQIFPDKKEISDKFFYENNIIDILAKDNYKELENKTIYILQFLGDINIPGFSSGEYLESYKINEFLHGATTGPESAGSPILYFYKNKFIVFGIHIKKKESKKLLRKINQSSLSDGYIRIGNFIYPIIDSLKRDDYIFLKEIKFTGEIYENKQMGNLLVFNDENGKYDKIYIGELFYYRPHGKGIIYNINPNLTKEDISEVIKDKYKKFQLKKYIKKTILYCGDFIEGKYNGEGVLYYNIEETDFYEGEFKNNLRNGKGKYYKNNKLIYEGEFKDDKFDIKENKVIINGGYYENKKIKIKEKTKGNNNSRYEYKKEENESNKSVKNLENNVNMLLSIGNEFLKSFNIYPNLHCANCGCSSRLHYFIGNNIWKCKGCHNKCENNMFENFK